MRFDIRIGWVFNGGAKPNDDLAPGTLNSILKQAWTQMSRYLIIIESTGTGFSACSPDLPGCVATGQTRPEVEQEMREAMEPHSSETSDCRARPTLFCGGISQRSL